jgi:hypothetical protein
VKLLPLLVVVIVLAFLIGSDSLFYLAYVLVGLWLLTVIWMRQALTASSAAFPRGRFTARWQAGRRAGGTLAVLACCTRVCRSICTFPTLSSVVSLLQGQVALDYQQSVGGAATI